MVGGGQGKEAHREEEGGDEPHHHLGMWRFDFGFLCGERMGWNSLVPHPGSLVVKCLFVADISPENHKSSP